MASVKRRADGQWRARYRGPDGRERARHFPTKAAAQKWLAGVEVSKTRGEWVDPALGKQTFGRYVEDWRATKADVAPRTLVNVDGRLRKHIVPFFGDMQLAAIRPTHVRSWVAGLVQAGMAPSTVKATFLTCSQVFAQAVRDGIIAKSPATDVKLPKERDREEMHFLTPGQVAAVAETIAPRFRAMVYAAAYTGMRAGELEGLRVDRVNLLAGTIDVLESMTEVGSRLIVGPTKTGRPRTIGIPRTLAEMLAEHIARFPSADGFVFTAPEGGPVRHRNFMRRHFRVAVDACDVPSSLRFHDLRHTCAALLIAQGRSMEEVKRHLGHSSIRVTSDRYGHLFPEARQELADRLDSLMSAAASATNADQARTEAEIVAFPNANQDAV